MALNFPDSPSLNDTYTFNNKTWVWNGTAWTMRFKTASIDGGTAYSIYTEEQTLNGGAASG
jgi:hypothetical protein